MSHFTTIKTQITDVEALRSAVNELGLQLLPNTEARGYISNKTKGDYVIRLKGPYDIAVNQQPDGTFGLTTDWWDGHVEKESAATSVVCCNSTASTRPAWRLGRRATPCFATPNPTAPSSSSSPPYETHH